MLINEDNSDEVDMNHCLAPTADLALQLPVNRVIFERHDEDVAALVLDLGPTDHLRRLVVRPEDLVRDGDVVLDFRASHIPECAECVNDGEVAALLFRFHASFVSDHVSVEETMGPYTKWGGPDVEVIGNYLVLREAAEDVVGVDVSVVRCRSRRCWPACTSASSP